MSFMRKVRVAIRNPRLVVEWLLRVPFPGHLVPDKTAIAIVYRLRFGRKINLDSPKTFNEKLLWLTLYDRRPVHNRMVDKYEAKKYIEEVLQAANLPTDCIIPTYGIYDSFDEIDFDSLPDSFVIKTTHDSGGVVVCHNKATLDIPSAKEKLEKSLRRNYYWFSREWAYKDVPPKIIVEKKLETADDTPKDYKVCCFNGKIGFAYIVHNRDEKGYYDDQWKYMPIKTICMSNPAGGVNEPKPQRWEAMKRTAEALSSGYPQLRVDFYIDQHGQFYVGELTLTNNGGLIPFEPDKYDRIFGDMLTLPQKTN